MRLAILGASGHGKVVADTAECCGWEQICFFDDSWPDKSSIGCWPVRGGTAELLGRCAAYDGVVVAIGNNAIRQAKAQKLREIGAQLVSLIHPQAIVSRYATVGLGSVVFASAVVNADAHVGEDSIINTGATVDHDCRLGIATHISPGAHLAGGVEVGSYSWIGIGAVVKQMVCIADNVTVGAGAVVVSDISDNQVVVGIPARSV